MNLPFHWDYPAPGQSPIFVVLPETLQWRFDTDLPARFPRPVWLMTDEKRQIPKLSADLTLEDTAHIVWGAATYIESEQVWNSDQEVLEFLLDNENFCLMPGELLIISPTTEANAPDIVEAGCCWGIESVGELKEFLETGRSPWLGHDPSPRLEKRADIIRLWNDGGLGTEGIGPFRDFTLVDYEAAVSNLMQDMNGFISAVKTWAHTVDAARAEDLGTAFRRGLFL